MARFLLKGNSFICSFYNHQPETPPTSAALFSTFSACLEMRKKRAGSPGDAGTLINFVSESWFSNNQILHWFKCYAYLHFNHRRSFFFFFFCDPSSVGVSIARSAERSMTLALNVRNTHTKTHSTVQWQYSFPLSLSLSLSHTLSWSRVELRVAVSSPSAH